MSIDQTPPLHVAAAPNWELPEVEDVSIKSATFQPKKPRHFASPLAAQPNVIEIVVTLKSPLPNRALPPVLYVGDTALTQSEALDKEGRRIRFWGLDRARLAASADAPIALGWLGASREGPAREGTARAGTAAAVPNRDLRTTRFRFKMPE
jgi:hypothetical protein